MLAICKVVRGWQSNRVDASAGMLWDCVTAYQLQYFRSVMFQTMVNVECYHQSIHDDIQMSRRPHYSLRR